jgi:hypothetical protein
MSKFLQLYKLWVDEPLLDTASKSSAIAYQMFKIPHTDLRTLTRMSGWSIFLVSSVFHPIVALPEEKTMAYAAGLMQLCTSLFFVIPAWKELFASSHEWNHKLYKQALTESAFRKEHNLVDRLVFFAAFLSYMPFLAWSLAFWDGQSQFGKITAIALLMYIPFGFLSDFLWAAEPPKPDDGDTFQAAVAQPS